MIDTWVKLVTYPDAEYEFLVEMFPYLAPSGAWDLESGIVYKYPLPVSDRQVTGVRMPRFLNAYADLIERASIVAVGANPGSWYFDVAANTVYVTALDLVPPNGGVIIFLECDFGSETFEEGDRLYKPLVKKGSLGGLQSSISDFANPIATYNFGSLKLINDGWWESNIEKYRWINAKVVVKVGGESLPYSEYKTVFVGNIGSWYVRDSEVEFELRDIRILTFGKVPRFTYNKTDYPNLDDNDVGKVIPLLYGEKAGIIPVCIDPTAGVGGKWKICKSNLSTRKIQSIVAVYKTNGDGTDPEGEEEFSERIDTYDWNADSGAWYLTGRTSGPEKVVSDGVELTLAADEAGVNSTSSTWFYSAADDRLYVHTDDDDTPANHEVYAITYGTGSASLVLGVDYTVDLNNGELTLLCGFDFESGDGLWVRAQGFLDASDNYLTLPGEIAEDILVNESNFIMSDLVTSTFDAVDAARAWPISLYIDTETGLQEILQKIGRSVLGVFIPTLDGKLKFNLMTQSVGELAAAPIFRDSDFKSWEVMYDTTGLKKIIKLTYDEDASGQAKFKTVEESNADVMELMGVREDQDWETYLTTEANALTLVEQIREMGETEVKRIKTQVGERGFDVLPGDLLKATRSRAASSTGYMIEEVFRVKLVDKDFISKKVGLELMEDVQVV